MALKTLAQNGKDKAKKSGDIRVVHIDGNKVAAFTAAKAAMARAEADLAEVEPFLKRAGSSEVFADNCRTGRPETKSVKLIDDTGAGVRVTLSAVYPAVNGEVATELFESTLTKTDGSKVDINDYVFQFRKAKFDAKAFIVDDEFNEKVYEAFFNACEAVAKKLKIINPLSTDIVTTVKPDFDTRRYTDFTASAQTAIYEVVPNKTSLTPIVGE